MRSHVIRVWMLDKFSVAYGEQKIEDNAKRVSKVWLLLAYLLCNRERILTQNELLAQIWGDEADGASGGILKTTMWRVRQLLETLDPQFGKDMILYNSNGYRWNPEYVVETDFEAFEALCKQAAQAVHKDRIGLYREALSLYESDFLERYSAEAWVTPLAAYYNNLYVETAISQLALLEQALLYEEVQKLSIVVLKRSPYNETVYQYLMRALMGLGEFREADEAYEELREKLFANLGVLPDKESQLLCKEIRRHLNHQFFSADVLRDQLIEKEPESGPIFCDFYVFRQFYQAEARSVSRRGDAIHVGMLTVAEPDNTEQAQYFMEQTMNMLQKQLAGQLRQGDIVSRCSASQFVILLQANYENSNMVCERVINAFAKAYPYSPAKIGHVVLSLEPLQVPRKQPEGKKKYSWK